MSAVAEPPPEDAAAQAEQIRLAAEIAALPLFVGGAAAAGGVGTAIAVGEAERRMLTQIVTGLARGIIHTTLMSATVIGIAAYVQHRRRSRQEEIEEALSKIVPDLVAKLEPDLLELQALDKGTALTSARLAASTFATKAYAETVVAVSGVMPTPPELEDMVLKKVWITQLDDAVRPLHRRLHGRVRLMDEAFWRWPDSGLSLSYPGDKSAPPQAWINCRCTMLLTWASKAKTEEALAAAVLRTGWTPSQELLHPRDTEGRFRDKPSIKGVIPTGIFRGNQYTKYGRTRTGPPATTVEDAQSRGFTEGPYYHSTDHASEIMESGFKTEGAETWEIQTPGSMEEFKRFDSVNQVWLGESRHEVEGYGEQSIEVWVKPGTAVDAGGKTLAGGRYVADPANTIPIAGSEGVSPSGPMVRERLGDSVDMILNTMPIERVKVEDLRKGDVVLANGNWEIVDADPISEVQEGHRMWLVPLPRRFSQHQVEGIEWTRIAPSDVAHARDVITHLRPVDVGPGPLTMPVRAMRPEGDLPMLAKPTTVDNLFDGGVSETGTWVLGGRDTGLQDLSTWLTLDGRIEPVVGHVMVEEGFEAALSSGRTRVSLSTGGSYNPNASVSVSTLRPLTPEQRAAVQRIVDRLLETRVGLDSGGQRYGSAVTVYGDVYPDENADESVWSGVMTMLPGGKIGNWRGRRRARHDIRPSENYPVLPDKTLEGLLDGMSANAPLSLVERMRQGVSPSGPLAWGPLREHDQREMAKDGIDLTDVTSPEKVEALKAALSMTTSDGFQVRAMEVWSKSSDMSGGYTGPPIPGEDVFIRGVIFDPEGRMAGEFTRTIRANGKVVYNNKLKLQPRVQGQGVGTEITRTWEDYWIAHGIERMDLSAGEEVGGYAWARAGYGWRQGDHAEPAPEFDFLEDTRTHDARLRDARNSVIHLLGRIRQSRTGMDREADVRKETQVMLDFALSARAIEDLPTPYELSEIGRRPGDETWPGKEGMLGESWLGSKPLEPLVAVAAAAALPPAVLADVHDRWVLLWADKIPAPEGDWSEFHVDLGATALALADYDRLLRRVTNVAR